MQNGVIYFPPRQDTETNIAVITSYQAKCALADAGLYDLVETAINAPETPIRIKLAWREGLNFQRNNPMILLLTERLGLTNEQVDDLFTAALMIEPGAL
uniref:hypothetical protein n=1 Tax=Cellvibrio fontiphilus TaxID=1815559 RepID=UPI002B4BB373|nr:hypothetical protein [Cellvibrio fontiphilus]